MHIGGLVFCFSVAFCSLEASDELRAQQIPTSPISERGRPLPATSPSPNPISHISTTIKVARISIDSVYPFPPVAGSNHIQVNFTVTGFTVPSSGEVDGVAGPLTLHNANNASGAPVSLSPGQSVSGQLVVSGNIVAGVLPVNLRYVRKSNCRDVPSPYGGKMSICDSNILAEASADVTVVSPVDHDKDKDGLDDDLEQRLLARFRPFYVFSEGEDFRPTDPLRFIRDGNLLAAHDQSSDKIVANSTLKLDPDAILTWTQKLGASSFQRTHCKTPYAINPSDADQPGESWDAVKTQRNVGLYGHVARDRISPNLVDIEYWQFYGFNYASWTKVGDHQGDWENIVVTVDPTHEDKFVAVTHYVHGKPITFHSFPSDTPISDVSGKRITLLGPNRLELNLDLDAHNDEDLALMQDVIIELECDGGACTHPVVYIERGTHASWPLTGWKFIAVPKHDGKGVSFLTSIPPNLGEPDHPFPTTPHAGTILNFSGYWGAWSRGLPGFVDTSSPHGPALHKLFARPSNQRPPDSCLE